MKNQTLTSSSKNISILFLSLLLLTRYDLQLPALDQIPPINEPRKLVDRDQPLVERTSQEISPRRHLEQLHGRGREGRGPARNLLEDQRQSLGLVLCNSFGHAPIRQPPRDQGCRFLPAEDFLLDEVVEDGFAFKVKPLVYQRHSFGHDETRQLVCLLRAIIPKSELELS
ncbi:hypothetical protein B0H63DRAFT_480183 [Podospora didyma]|uniref:Uncharacterized protein n=1 Tax=Podospora didyma TaxID=330526 RepID=A0AAE0KKX5_9PEZI|nr:hypothetical protein B0H63DRAFT_480183 [Podospora didyma]